ncbi:hypothetical protein [Streptomyces albipurpureus]|uniref:Uncharacterized protein n=1 Tax=Streptomyces albipurpureus TaxID=2897419 RepID=A0ABT0V0Q4_9ACTN|nr:hypothetical protein [Streptomyces sp. CWNU-1]MCM2394432.1 hypothetical protein [Streptomyces sp. CWNU-1]
MTTRTFTCTDCHRPIRWTITQAGKRLAVDPTPDPAGNTAVWRDGTGAWCSRRPTLELPLCGWERLHKPHVATCPTRQAEPPLPAGVTRLETHRKSRRRYS